MVNATDCRSVSWGFDSLPRLSVEYGYWFLDLRGRGQGEGSRPSGLPSQSFGLPHVPAEPNLGG